MRVLAITQLYSRADDESYCPFNQHQLRHLAFRRDVRVVAPIAWTRRLAHFNRPGEPRHYRNSDGIWVDHPTYYYPPRMFRSLHGECFLRSIRRQVSRVVDEFHPDVIFSAWAHPDGWAAVRLGRRYGLPVVIKVVGTDVLVLARQPERRRRIAEALCGADAVVAVSDDLARHVTALGVPAERVSVIPEGVDTELFRPGPQKEARAALGLPASGRRLLFVGNLLWSKGIAVLLEACELLRKRGMEFVCDFVGEGADKSLLLELATQLGLSEVVRLAGARPQHQLPNWYRASDLLVLPSFSEGIPNVLREAMMCGRGFVATRVGGIPEITHPSFGLLVEPRNVAQLSDAIAAALERGLRADRHLALSLNVSWGESACLLENVLERVCAPRRTARDAPLKRQCTGDEANISQPIGSTSREMSVADTRREIFSDEISACS